MNCRIVVRDEVWCLITGLSPLHADYLWNKFGVYVDGYRWMPAFKLGRWDGKIRFFEKTGKTYVRLLDQILPLLQEWNYDCELIDKRKAVVNPVIKSKITAWDEHGIAIAAEGLDIMGDIEIAPGKKFQLRPYQLECIIKAVEAGSGFIIAGTGAGKTSITAGLSYVYGQMGYRVITIVPSSDLVTQTFDWYDLLQLDVGVYSGSSKDLDHQYVVATWQAIQNNLDIMKTFDVLIWDEAHGVKSQIASKIVNEAGADIPFRFGVTGTFPLPEAEKLSLFSSIGPILKTIPAAWLIDNGFLSKVEIQPIEIQEVNIDEDFPDYASEKAFLSKSPDRMEAIADVIVTMAAKHGNTLILVNSIPFGEKLASLIKGAVFLYGDSPKDLRKEHYDMFEEHDDLIVIASSGIASTGISIDRVFALGLVDAGKSFIKAIQTVGRGLRIGHDKNYVFVFDIFSKLKWAKKHFKDRDKYYKEAQYPVLKKLTLKVKSR